MTSAALRDYLPDTDDADAVYERFVEWSESDGLALYDAQEEAIVALASGEHVVLSTPTGTGKSLVAVAAHFAALAGGRRSYYTAPIKALVSEKFFALVALFGAQNVGMVTGDSSVNPEAPIVCCTAEILAGLALREGDGAADVVIMDEFHYYADADRGWAWQVPLIELPSTQFLLMSATLGDVSWLADDLRRRTGRGVTEVTGVERPVPLDYRYAVTPVHETVEQLLTDGLAPVYVVHFSQAAALERAQALSSIKVVDRARRDEIAEAIADFRFSRGFGTPLSRLVRSGIGVHHAGMLPKYRRLVEQLAQRGLLRVICGTDTLGVGINVPIRTVLLTGLSKFDGTRMRHLGAREFHQIAGRAGRAGFDTAGTVVLQAPEHETENIKALAKAGDDPKKKRKVVRKKAPDGFVSWGEPSFHKLIAAAPERLTPQLRITHSMLLALIARGGDVVASVRHLVETSHEPRARQRELLVRALAIYRTLRAAGVVEQVPDGNGGMVIRLTVDLPSNFALNQPLSPFALAALELLDPQSESYALDLVSVIEATLDNPRPVLAAQQNKARGEAVAAMKAEGLEYEERMELLEEVTHPRPLAELLEQQFAVFVGSQPWIAEFELAPKSVVRDFTERAMTFTEYVSFYDLARSEGLVLRYLSDAFRALDRTVPEAARSEEVHDLIAWLGELVRQVDSSLLDEWEALAHPERADEEQTESAPPPAPPSLTRNARAFGVLVRNAMFRRVQLAALEKTDQLAALDPDFGRAAWEEALDGYFADYDVIGTGPGARSAALLQIDKGDSEWRVRQVFDDPAGDRDWAIEAVVDLAASDESGEPVVRVTAVAPR